MVVHTDRKAPVVSVHVWYHVGSKDEPKGDAPKPPADAKPDAGAPKPKK